MQIRSVGIVGTGLMGTGIAWEAALKGFDVTIVKWTPGDPLGPRMKFYEAVEKQRERGKLTMQDHMTLKTRIAWSADPADLADSDLVIESIVEEMETKRACARRIDAILKPEALLA